MDFTWSFPAKPSSRNLLSCSEHSPGRKYQPIRNQWSINQSEASNITPCDQSEASVYLSGNVLFERFACNAWTFFWLVVDVVSIDVVSTRGVGVNISEDDSRVVEGEDVLISVLLLVLLLLTLQWCQPIRSKYCLVWANQKQELFSVGQ